MGKNNQKNKNYLLLALEVVLLGIFVYAAIQLYLIFKDYQIASKEYDVLAENMVVVLQEDFEENSKKEMDLQQETSSSYDYEIPHYEVDLNAVKAQNSDTVGWIILPDSKINYPIVKSKDNTEYLTTTFEGKVANSGAIFMDMYCENDFSSQNTIVYGHNMKNGSMFRALNNMTDKDYFLSHHIFCIDIGNGFEEYEIISCYETVETDLSSWQIGFESYESYETWLKNIVKRCNYDCADYDAAKNTITLSTCRGQSGGPGRFIVHLQKKY